MPVVYIATNRINGNRYVGATKHSLEYRRKKHIKDCRCGNACRAFYAAIRKYGDQAFEWSVLAEFDTVASAMAFEIETISQMRPEYNIARGGQGVAVPYTEDRRRKVSNALRGRKLTPEARLIAIKGLDAGREKRQRKVVCLNDGRIFASMKLAAAFYDLRYEGVRAVVDGHQTHTGGLSFVASDGAINQKERSRILSLHRLRKEKESDRISSGVNSRAISTSDGREFRSAVDGAKALGCKPPALRYRCAKGVTVDGIKVWFSDAGFVVKKEKTASDLAAASAARKVGRLKANAVVRKMVICNDSRRVYASITEAAADNGVCISAISAAIYRNGRAGGKSFKFFNGAG